MLRLTVKKYQSKELGKLIEYILFHRPDEFGLFLDDDDSLPIKELMWALHEETGWKHIRLGHLKELAYSGLELAFTLEETQIRPKREVSKTASDTLPPQLLFFGARRKAYPVILKHGLRPGSRLYVPLATTEEMALRIGKRRDPKPILLTVHAAQAHDSGHPFSTCGDLLYLVKTLPAPFLSGPPLREPPPSRKIPKKEPPKPLKSEVPEMTGSFLLDPERDPDPMRRQRRKREKEQKRQRTKERRDKKRRRS
ncbi:MAG: RNA 2'-phosphotransferase [Deltaproteobacteria bacterium]|jgi:putative RNA 2'-phosphotransferase